MHQINRSQIATLNEDEANLKSQIVTSNDDSPRSQFVTLNGRGQNIKYLPYAFTENGIAMLSSVLRSPLAIETHKWRNASHDRWIIVDDTLYHCGHSLKDTGNKLSCIDVITSISADVVLNYVR